MDCEIQDDEKIIVTLRLFIMRKKNEHEIKIKNWRKIWQDKKNV